MDSSAKGRLIQDELAELIIQANRYLESDQDKARCCIRRAVQLVSAVRESVEHQHDGLAVRGGLAVWQLKKLRAFIAANLGSRLLTSDLAAHIHMSNGHFCRAFRNSFGMPPHSYVIRQRISRAEVMMTTSRESLARIAIACGLADQAHFSRLFRRIVGVSPRNWRRTSGASLDPR
jgi:transcriptional regulator GlxA family with amidase domain